MDNPWLVSDKALIRYSTTTGEVTTEYIAQAPRYTSPTDASWRAFRVERTQTGGAEVERVTHCPEAVAPGEDGANLPGLTYL